MVISQPMRAPRKDDDEAGPRDRGRLAPMEPWPGLAAFARSAGPGNGLAGELFYFDTAPEDRTRPVLILVHGLGDEADTWRALIPLLAGRLRLIAPDLPGFGRSSSAGSTTMRDCARTLIGLMDALGIETAWMAGSSLGAAIAELAAFASPGRVSGLALVDGGLPSAGKPAPGLLAMALPVLGSRRYTALRADHAKAVATLYPYYGDFAQLPEDDRAFLERRVVERVESDRQRRAYLSLLRSAVGTAFREGGRFAAGLAAWRKPLALVWGSLDRIMPREGGEAISRLAPGAALRVIEGAGHLPQQERPEELAKILTELIFG